MAEISLTEVEPRPTAVVREVVAVSDLPGFFHRAFSAVAIAVQGQNVSVAGVPFGLFHGVPTDRVDVEAGFPLSRPIEASGPVTPSSLPGGRVVTALHVGPYDTLDQTYAELTAWMSEQSLTPGEDMWEEYLSDPEEEPDPATWRTRISCPVASTSA